MNQEDLDYLRGVAETIRSAYPESPRIRTYGEWTVVRLHRAALGNFLGIISLAEALLGIEAMILLRSLYWNTVRLDFLELKPGRLEERSMRLAYSALKEELALERQAHEVFSGNEDAIEDIEDELQHLKAELKAIGVDKIKRLPDEKDMAVQIGEHTKRPLLDFLSQITHGSERSRSVGIERSRDDQGQQLANLKVKTDPSETLLVALGGAAAFVEASRAKASILGWSEVEVVASVLADETMKYIREVQARLP